MKQTDFKFHLDVATDDPATLTNLKENLLAFKGVNTVTCVPSLCDLELSINVSFEHQQQAVKLHRQIMTSIMECPNVTIRRVVTMLTDIF